MSSVPNEGDTSVNIDNIDTAYVNRLSTDSLSDSEPSVKVCPQLLLIFVDNKHIIIIMCVRVCVCVCALAE